MGRGGSGVKARVEGGGREGKRRRKYRDRDSYRDNKGKKEFHSRIGRCVVSRCLAA